MRRATLFLALLGALGCAPAPFAPDGSIEVDRREFWKTSTFLLHGAQPYENILIDQAVNPVSGWSIFDTYNWLGQPIQSFLFTGATTCYGGTPYGLRFYNRPTACAEMTRLKGLIEKQRDLERDTRNDRGSTRLGIPARSRTD